MKVPTRHESEGNAQTQQAAPQVAILIVEDEPGNVLALEAALEPLRQKVVSSGSAAETSPHKTPNMSRKKWCWFTSSSNAATSISTRSSRILGNASYQ